MVTTKRIKIILLFCIVSMGSSLVEAQNKDKSSTFYIKAGKMFNGTRSVLLSEQVIRVEGDRISAVGSDIKIPKGSRVVDLSDYTVMPGLIDSHVHLFYSESPKGSLSGDAIGIIAMEGDALRSLRASAKAKTFLQVGYTTVKDLGNSGMFLDVALKRAIDEGTVVGPRMIVSGPIISSEGGQFPGLLHNYSYLAEKEYRVVRGEEDAINAVRENITYGADIIKICANNSPNNTTLTLKEMEAIVKTAHRYGVKVTAHATDNRAIWEAVQAGVDGIEHGYAVADSTLALMAKKGVVLVPTDASRKIMKMYMDMRGMQEGEEGYVEIAAMELEGTKQQIIEEYLGNSYDRLGRALKQGVTIVAGSDTYLDLLVTKGESAKNTLVSYHEAGMKPLDVLKTATYNAAKFLGRDDIGIIQKGALADIVAVRGDIKKDFVKTLFDVVLVMKDGKIFFHNSTEPKKQP